MTQHVSLNHRCFISGKSEQCPEKMSPVRSENVPSSECPLRKTSFTAVFQGAHCHDYSPMFDVYCGLSMLSKKSEPAEYRLLSYSSDLCIATDPQCSTFNHCMKCNKACLQGT